MELKMMKQFVDHVEEYEMTSHPTGTECSKFLALTKYINLSTGATSGDWVWKALGKPVGYYNTLFGKNP